jgi:hypothetical protein
MGIWSTEWANGLFLEAMKFWFYSITFSIMLSLLRLYRILLDSGSSSKKPAEDSERTSNVVDAEAKRASATQWNVVKTLAIDCCDIFVPGFTTGWLRVSSGNVGTLSMISSVLASTEIWRRVQRHS